MAMNSYRWFTLGLALGSLMATLIIGASLKARGEEPTIRSAAICGFRSQIISQLKARFEEFHEGTGLIDEHNLLELYVSPTKGTWSIIASTNAGFACVIAAGSHWFKALPSGRPL